MKLVARHRRAAVALALGVVLVTGPAFAGSIAPVYEFAGGPRGIGPTAAPVQDIAGNLYGETSNGGSCTVNPKYGCGVVYKISPSGRETVLLTFQGSDGIYGAGPLTLVGKTLFGTANEGGTTNDGMVFSINTDGTGFTILHQFSGGAAGAYPSGALLQGPQGVLYGMAGGGDAYGDGVIYSLTTSGSYTLLHTFTGGADGRGPNSIVLSPKGIIVGADGSPYTPCKASSCGVVFAVNPATGEFGVLATFFQGLGGTKPMVGGVTSDNVIYGATEDGGTGDEGTLFEIVQVGARFKRNVLYSFNAATDGELPSGGPVLAPDGSLIGTTFYSANGAQGGTFYSFANGVLTTLNTFTTTDSEGWEPQATPLLTPSGTVIGANEWGGDATCKGQATPFNCGAIYSYTP